MPRSAALAVLIALAASAAGQPPARPAQKDFPPDVDMLARIGAKTAELRAALAGLPEKPNGLVPREDVEVYLKAAEWVVRHGEWFHKDSVKHTLAVLDAGLARAAAARAEKAPWLGIRGRPIIRGYRSRIDGSVQPYAVTLPAAYPGVGKQWRLDVVLHGRDQTLSEVKFIHAKEAAKPGPARGWVVLEPYGRGNNAYRWAGETDVLEAVEAFKQSWSGGRIDDARVVLRGFSMGGAGTWHLGLHRPCEFAAIQPGAGFTTTRGYVKNLPEKLPEHVERCLHIYDAADYAENAFNVPVVAYSGEKDPQKAAADAVAARLAAFKEPVRFTHLVAPGLEHKQPPEWATKADAEIALHLPRKEPERVRFVTYTTKYDEAAWVGVRALDRHYDRTVVDAKWAGDAVTVTTENVRVLSISRGEARDIFDGRSKAAERKPKAIAIDGQKLEWPWTKKPDWNVPTNGMMLAKTDGKWERLDGSAWHDRRGTQPEKVKNLQGPIDDAFTEPFLVVPPAGDGWHPAATAHATASYKRFAREWDKYYRGDLPTKPAKDVPADARSGHLVLFGDPGSNPLIAEAVAGLPIVWTKDTLVVNGVSYDPKTHVPVLIAPNPRRPYLYVVINSGHTFREADLKWTNALLYPRLGDWAVLRPVPTKADPAAAEEVTAGLFDEFWKFPSK